MSRITKQIAEATAKKLTEKHSKEITEISNELKEFVTDIYLKTIPPKVLITFNNYPDFFRTTTNVQVVGPGLSYQHVNLTQSYPNESYRLSLSQEEADVVVALLNKISDKNEKVCQLKNEIENVLFSLRTYANVQKQFPEAYALLPVPSNNTGLIVNIDSLRSQITLS